MHSLHSYFLRPGDPTVPILYEVDRIRDGRSFTTREVVAIQHGRAIFNVAVSFHVDEVGAFDHQFPMPDVPDPEQLPTLFERLEPMRDELSVWFAKPHPIEQRHIGELPWMQHQPGPPCQRLWIRADGELPDDPLLHACIATYASDMSLFDTMLAPHVVNLGTTRRSWERASTTACGFTGPFGQTVGFSTTWTARARRSVWTCKRIPLHPRREARRVDGARRAYAPGENRRRELTPARRVEISAGPSGRSRASRLRRRADVAGPVCCPGRAARASAPAIPRCAGSRRAQGTWRAGIPSPGR